MKDSDWPRKGSERSRKGSEEAVASASSVSCSPALESGAGRGGGSRQGWRERRPSGAGRWTVVAFKKNSGRGSGGDRILLGAAPPIAEPPDPATVAKDSLRTACGRRDGAGGQWCWCWQVECGRSSQNHRSTGAGRNVQSEGRGAGGSSSQKNQMSTGRAQCRVLRRFVTRAAARPGAAAVFPAARKPSCF